MNHKLVQIGLRVPDVDAYVEHVQSTLGVAVTDPDADGRVALALPGQSPCLVLIQDAEASLNHIGLVTSAAGLAEVARRADAAGLAAHDGRDFGTLRLYAPNRLAVELRVAEPEARNTTRDGVGPLIGSLDHVSLNASDLDGTVAFFVEVLGFRLSDSVGTVRHWLRCGPTHHDVAVFSGEDRLQHYAFETDDLNELGHLGDLLALRGQNFLWGPGRHALGANVFTYHLDPAGAILEVTTGMIEVADEQEWVTQVWSPDTPASAVMWGPYPPADFRTTSIAIHDHGER